MVKVLSLRKAYYLGTSSVVQEGKKKHCSLVRIHGFHFSGVKRETGDVREEVLERKVNINTAASVSGEVIRQFDTVLSFVQSWEVSCN